MNKLYVGNLSFSSTDESLDNFARDSGVEVDRVSVISDMHTGRSRGFGFIELADSQDVDAAIEALNGKELDGRVLRVDRARERTGGGGPRGGGGGGRGRSGRGGPRRYDD